MELYELTATEAARRMRAKDLSPVELAESLLGRIGVLESRLKAWVYLDPEAVLESARRKEEEVGGGTALGQLHGVPIGLKDIYYTAGIPTTACSKLYADFVPDYDATTVKLLKDSGAIVMGKTVTTEFACMDPSPTMNPWNPDHTPGGSSSGSAVAVAARMCPTALGSQTVGSVLRPASYNGVVGFKPTFGLVSRRGVVPVSWSLDTVGWMARSVEDTALLLQVLAGPDPLDPFASRAAGSDYLAALTDPVPPRIGLVRGYFDDHSDDESRRHIEAVAQQLSRAGASVEEVEAPPSMSTALADQQLIMAVEGGAFHQAMYEERASDYQPKLREMIQRGLSTAAATYSQALESRQRFVADVVDLMGAADVFLTPATPSPALADLTNTGDPKFQGPWTSAGVPAISLPSGLAASGLPLGVQLAAAPFADARLLAAAKWCEAALDVHLSPSL